MINIIRLPVRILVFMVGWLAYWMEVAADWVIGVRNRTEYVRLGKCKRCGRCCRCLALVMPQGISRRSWLVRMVGFWHSFAMNFKFVSEEKGWLVYRCGYYREVEGQPGRCAIYPFRHRLCRFFPRQGLYSHPSVHPDCGYKFVRRDVMERRHRAKREGRVVFDDLLAGSSTPLPSCGDGVRPIPRRGNNALPRREGDG